MDLKNIQISKEGLNTTFRYCERSIRGTLALGGEERIFHSRGLIPMAICCEGEEAVRQYAEEVTKKDIAMQELVAVWQDYFAANANFPVIARAGDGTILRGRIISIKAGEMLVHLDKPQERRGLETYDFRSSNGGMPSVLPGEIFGQDMSGFSGKVVGIAQKLLIKKYNQQGKTQPYP